jgi:lipopolysaccharide/colanic/teichoic acid biosynthesis glycosyltransferase
LLHLGIVTVVVGLAKLHASRAADVPYDLTASSRFAWTLAFVVMLSLAAYGLGLPEVPRTRRGIMLSSAAAPLLGGVGISLAQLALADPLLPRFVVFSSVLVLTPWYMLCGALADDGRARDEWRDRVVVVGDWADATALSFELEHRAERPALVVDVLTPEQAVATPAGELPLRDVVQAVDGTVVVLDRIAQLEHSIVEQVADLHEGGVRVRTLSLFYEEWLGKLPLSELERVSLMFDIGEVHRIRYGRQKRLIDIALGVFGAIALAVAVPFVFIGNLIGNRGSLLFRQERVGKGGQAITIFKFRTMRTSSTGSGEWTEVKDVRITRFGAVLRRTHLDELPQVLNILRGDLSVVGPRPEQPHYVAELTEKLPFYSLRHLVRPGLTGWAQVKFGYAGSESDALEKLQYEFYYLRHQSLSLDLRIVARTVRHLVRGGGR